MEPREALSLAECRRLIGTDCPLSDEELLSLRDQFYALANIAISMHVSATATWEELDECERYNVGERAAILEFEGKLPRVAAERLAMAQLTTAKPSH